MKFQSWEMDRRGITKYLLVGVLLIFDPLWEQRWNKCTLRMYSFSALHADLINYKRTSSSLIYWNLKLLARIQGLSQASSLFLRCDFNSGGANAFFFHEVQNDTRGHNRRRDGWLGTAWTNLLIFKSIHCYWFHSYDCFLNVFEAGH